MGKTFHNPLVGLGLLGIMLTVGCAGAPKTDPAILYKDWANYLEGQYQIRSGDRIQVSVVGIPDLQQEVTIDPQGNASLLRIGLVRAAGRTVEMLRTTVQGLYAKVLTEPRVNLALLEPVEQVVYVGGELRAFGGVVPYRPGLTLFRAILASGSFDPVTAKTSEVFIMRNHRNGKYNQYRIDLAKIAYEGAPDVPLLPNDAVFVQTSGGADVANFVELYFRRMLPVSAGTVTGAYVGAAANR